MFLMGGARGPIWMRFPGPKPLATATVTLAWEGETVLSISRPAPVVRERRQWVRMPCNIPATWSAATERQRPELEATVRNCCPGGLGLLVVGSSSWVRSWRCGLRPSARITTGTH